MEAIINLFKRMGFAKLAILFGTLSVFSVLFFLILSKYLSADMITLYNNLEVEDSNKITAILDNQNIQYELKQNGSQILVPSDKALKLRMQLAQEGVPSKGSITGYEIFDKTDAFNTSNFVQNIYLLRALEGELSRTIASFEQIKSARVHLVIPRRELFSRDNQQTSASVVLELRGSASLNKEQIQAISHLVATAVPGLDISKITIVNTKGKSLKLSDDDGNTITSSVNSAQDYKIAYEAKLKRTIEELLEKSVGIGKVEAQVAVDINFDRIVTNSEIFDPNGQVPRSVQTIEEKESSTEKDSKDQSIANNLPNPATASTDSGKSSSNSTKTDETTNYEISKTIKNQISETGTVHKLSIAVLIDGTYTQDTNTGQTIYTPRPAEQLRNYEKLVQHAVGFDSDRGDQIQVMNMQFIVDDITFKEETLIDWLKLQLHDKLYNLIQTIIISIVLILTILFFIRPFIYKIFDTAAAAIQAQVDAEIAIAQAEVEAANASIRAEREEKEALNMKDNINAEDRIKIKQNPAFKSVNDILRQAPQESLIIIKNWLNS